MTDLINSKKFKVLLGGVIILIIQSLVPELASLDTEALIALMAAYLVGQGVADHGKEAAKFRTQEVAK